MILMGMVTNTHLNVNISVVNGRMPMDKVIGG